MSDSSPLPDLPMIGAGESAGPTWQEQDDLLRQLWMQNKTPQEISEALGRSPPAIMTRAARLGLPRRAAPGRKPNHAQRLDDGTREKTPPMRDTRRVPARQESASNIAAQTAERVCLMCLNIFQSLGRHNRICPSCKHSSEYESASALADIHLPSR